MKVINLSRRLIEKLKSGLETNDRIVIKNALFAFLIKGLALAVSLFSTPAMMRYFDNSVVLGVWYTVLSVLIWVLNFDLGIGNGLRNHLVSAIAAEDTESAKRYISSALFSIGFITVIFSVIGVLLFGFLNWNAIFGVSAEDIPPEVLRRVVEIVFVGILIRLFLTTVNAIIYAIQKSALNNALSLITSGGLLLFVLNAGGETAPDKLQVMACGYVIISNLPLVAAGVLLFKTTLKNMRPGIGYIDRRHMKAVLSLGVMFFICQILYMAIANTNEFFISNLFGPANVVDYQVYYKLTSLVAMCFSLMLTPIWSAITKAAGEENYLWLNRLYRMMKRSGAAVVGLELLLVPFMQLIVNVWLGDRAITIRTENALAFAFFGGLLIYQSILSTVVCGLGKMKLQAICYTATVALKFVLVIVGSRYMENWILVVLSTAVVLLPYCVIEQTRLNGFLKRRLAAEEAAGGSPK